MRFYQMDAEARCEIWEAVDEYKYRAKTDDEIEKAHEKLMKVFDKYGADTRLGYQELDKMIWADR